MRNKLLEKLQISHSPNNVRKMILIKRSANSQHTRNGHDLVRQWSDDFTIRILNSLKEAFPSYDVSLFTDKNETLMRCHSCQIEHVAHADVLIGVHGAGLANQLYMKHNSAIVELGPYSNDGRILLGGGPFSRLAALLSHNYMIHHPPHEEYTWIAGKTSEFDISLLVKHMKSFLSSLNNISVEAI